MSSTEVDNGSRDAAVGTVDFRFENQVIAVSDVDRAKEFYQSLGWRFDDDVAPLDGLRIVQFTPPGSAASVTFGVGLTTATPGSAQAVLVVSDIEAAHDERRQPWHRRERHLARPAVPCRGSAARSRSRAHQLRVVLLLHRSRRQCLDSPGDHDAAPRPVGGGSAGCQCGTRHRGSRTDVAYAERTPSVRSRRASSPGCLRLAELKWFDMVTPSLEVRSRAVPR